MTDKTWGPFELLAAHRGQVPHSFVERRRIAAAMRTLAEQMIRVEASDDQLRDWAAQLESLVAAVGAPPRRNTRDANRRLFSGQASSFDVFDMMDYDPMGGRSNPISPLLDWQQESADGVTAEIMLGEQYQGPPGRVHGGVIAWIMDAVLSRAMHAALKLGVTGTLTLRYRAATPIDSALHCHAHIERVDGRKLVIKGGIRHGEVQTVEAEGIFLQPDFSKRRRAE